MEKFFEIFNISLWLLLFELLYIPGGMFIGGLIYLLRHKEKDDEVQ